ncbi:propionyl-CoA carboxylase alpha chain, mitochondrial [Tribolium castaneum]|uniref:propionyl-CoA carboxylase n=1 Tax=Tribolium castaneum TaxID=7070 RepID=D6WLD7_TRICA|nr:PREDICTED: propionyl-CoA carboxylase alpha chain, mitochondrial [Tribolium castaneum]EFA03463.2 Propionyl-CoA carboxylase alpha chain, mitochondrial-like Protein [Tribolium castaneum]|eukprot:XP_015836150.1 PREDICTED: propionyl-CoA carboxylase alpha chain, mitochondrial [Tribolium castaneum]
MTVKKFYKSFPKNYLQGPSIQNVPIFRNFAHHKTPASSTKSFSKILVANRGEIACRIIKTAKKMNLKTVAVYSEADAFSPHVKLADEAVFLGPSLASESYLNIKKIIDAVKSTGAEAVHPGYGFLSENASFVSLLEDEKIVFVGPPAGVINKLGDKLASKKLAQNAGVNVIPGFDGEIRDAKHCVEIARQIGYPVMIKASAGGGGKGMRIARNDDDARNGFQMSTEEAASSFGDNRILLEKLIESPRHVEVQVLGDKHGRIVYLNERECSIQRRNQKIVEEAPSTFLDVETRKAMGEQAVRLCTDIGYHSAGTVEFLVDKNRAFYFLEMNTRLQVEHPVTEAITGVDIVQQMIRIAQGYPLDVTQEDVKINGHAIECRIYAEDPYKNLGSPSIGKLFKYREPNRVQGIRCDSGVEEGSEITFYYDSMICKLICFGKDRQEAIKKSTQALDYYVVRGVTHNVPLLRSILSHERFAIGDINTNFLSEAYPNGFGGHELNLREKNQLLAIASAFYVRNDSRNRVNNPTQQNEWNVVVKLNRDTHTVRISERCDFFEIEINDSKVYKINKMGLNLAEPVTEIKLNGEQAVVQLISKNPSGDYKISYLGTTYDLNIIPKKAADLLHLMPQELQPDISKTIKSPMPGLIKSLSCKEGDCITEGQELCTIEAMKMQNSIIALTSGKIKTVYIKEGSVVSDNDVLIDLE